MWFRKGFDKSMLPYYTSVASMAEQRHAMLSDNIANADTPYYKVKDVNHKRFNEILDEAYKKRQASAMKDFDLNRTCSVTIEDNGFHSRFKTMHPRKESELRHDENNFDVERQMALLAKNQMLHNTAVAMIRKEFFLMQQAISDRIL